MKDISRHDRQRVLKSINHSSDTMTAQHSALSTADMDCDQYTQRREGDGMKGQGT